MHIHFHDELPLSAMQAGADMAATSVHKLGGSLTQSSILNIKEGLVSKDRVQSILSMLTTTSTSYLLLASLDVARKRLATEGKALADEAIRLAESARTRLNEIEGITCIGQEILGSPSTYDYDPTKLIISIKDLGLNGHDVEKWLRESYRIEVELSDLYNILCIVTPGDCDETIDTLVTAMKEIAATSARQGGKQAVTEVLLPEILRLR